MHYNWKTEHALKRAIQVQFLQIRINIIITMLAVQWIDELLWCYEILHFRSVLIQYVPVSGQSMMDGWLSLAVIHSWCMKMWTCLREESTLVGGFYSKHHCCWWERMENKGASCACCRTSDVRFGPSDIHHPERWLRQWWCTWRWKHENEALWLLSCSLKSMTRSMVL